MCGIVGIASGPLSLKEVGMFDDLMIVSNLRGRQGSGIITIGKEAGGKDLHLHNIKVLGSGVQAISSSEYRKRAYGGTPSVLVGHTRWPTKGGTDINAVHPHVFDKVVGVHNGTLQRVAQSYVTQNESDSSLFYQSVNDLGIEEALAQAKGAYALVFVDTENQTLNFIRNHERPLYIAKIRWGMFGKTAMWASEADFLSLILRRSGYKENEYEIVPLPINELWSLPIPMHGHADFSVEKGVLSDLRSFKPYIRPHGGSAWYDNTFLDGKSGTTHKQAHSLVHLPQGPSPLGKETYVFRDGVLVAKSDPSKQVFLPPSSQGNERQGAETDAAPVGSSSSEGNDNEQRRAASEEVPDRTRVVEADNLVSLEFRRELRKALSRDQNEFEDDLSDIYASRTLVDAEDDPIESVDLLDIANYGDDPEDSLVETVDDCWIPYREAKKILDHGCEYCGNGVTFRDHVSWVGRREFLCEDCCSDGNALEEMRNHYPNSKIVGQWLSGKLRDAPKPPEDWFNVDGTFDGTQTLQ